MKLNYLQLCNFRQFYGKTPQIKFASGTRNTTVIYGNNGAGKTSILNAFTWVLYKKFTAAFASPELLINQRAIAEVKPEQAVECWVELQFERDRKIYQLKRKCYANKNAERQVQYSQTKLFMLVAGDDGRWYPPLEAPEDIINRILPASLHQYFFFDGERIDGFFRQNHNSHIAEDTKELLGVKILDGAIEHLKIA
ncbi:MAG: ATP-binding protein, partial [Waterburya sp.]